MIKWFAVFMFLLSPAICQANGGPNYFENIFEQKGNDWQGHAVFYLEPTGGTLELQGDTFDDWFELAYLWNDMDPHFKRILLFPTANGKIFKYQDINLVEKFKEDDQIMQRYLVFKEGRLNRSPTLAIVPKRDSAVAINDIARVRVDTTSLTFLTTPPPENVILELRDGFDLTGDDKADIMVYGASNDSYMYT